MEKLKILIVEDDAIIATAIESQLQSLGYDVTSIVDTGEKAIEKVEVDKPDLILMDIHIKGNMDGIDTAEVIRNKFGIPVIFSTAFLDTERIERAKITIPFGYVLKPVQERDLKVTLEMALHVAKIDEKRKQTEDNLRKSEELYRRMYNETPAMLHSIDREGNLGRVSDRWLEVLGYNREEVIGRRSTDFLTAESRKYAQEIILPEFFEVGYCIDVPYQFLKKNGQIVDVLLSANSERDESGEIIRTLAYLNDVTERRQAEKALSISEKKYRELANLLPQVVFETNEKGDLLFVNLYAFEIFGYTHSDFEKGLSALEMVAPEEQEKALINMSRILEGEILGGTEYVMQRKGGSKFPAIVHSTRIVHEDVPIGLRGIIIDITDRKKIEQELQTSEKKYRQIFENGQTPYYEASLDGILLEVSPSVEKYLKYKREELLGRTILDLYEDSNQRDTFVNKLLEKGELIDEEVRVKDKDGTVLTTLLSSKYIPDDQKIVGSLLDITARKRAEEKLMSSEETFRSVVESSPMGIFMYRLDANEQLVFTGANPAADRILGIDNSQFIGKTIQEAFPPLIETEVPHRYHLAAADGISWHSEQINYEDKKIKGAYEVHAFQLTPGNMAALFFDITERKQAEEALKNSEERFRQLAESIKEVFWIVSPDWNEVYYVSPAFKDVWQINEKELYQNALLWTDAIVKEDRNKVEDFLHEIQQKIQKGTLNEVIFPEYRISRPDGSEKWILARGFPIYNENGQVYRVVGIAKDITEMKKTNELIIQTEKMMSVGGLAAGMAHELNNPLGGILQGIQNIQRRLSPDLKSNFEPAKEFGIDLHGLQSYMDKRGIHAIINGVQESGKKASQIISSMLQFSRKSESTLAPINLTESIENVLELAGKDFDLKKKFDFRNIKVIKEFDSNLPLIPCTQTEIEQVILNLLNNAAWAMANEKSADPPQIILRVHVEKQMARIEIEDSGPGLDDVVRKRIFEPFFTTKPVGEGTGLGLSVSYMIITNNHKGTMEVESEPGKGTKFIIRLPLDRESVA